MATITLSIQEALSKKKIYEANLNKRLNRRLSSMVIALPKTAETVNGIKREDAIEIMKAEFTSIKHLQSNLTAIKVAINASNAVTKITVAGKEYIIADAIARLRALDQEKDFYNVCMNQYEKTISNIKNTNADVLDPDNIARYVSSTLDNNTKKNELVYNSVVESYKADHLLELIDPNNFGKILQEWDKEIIDFEASIHNALVASNINTFVTVELAD